MFGSAISAITHTQFSNFKKILSKDIYPLGSVKGEQRMCPNICAPYTEKKRHKVYGMGCFVRASGCVCVLACALRSTEETSIYLEQSYQIVFFFINTTKNCIHILHNDFKCNTIINIYFLTFLIKFYTVHKKIINEYY